MALDSRIMKLVSQRKGQYSGMSAKAIKPKDGRNLYRIIAPKADWVEAQGGQFWADLGIHWIKADENGKPIAVVGDCDTVYQKPSVLNAAIDMAIDGATDEASKKLYQSWKARKSVLINVIDRNDKSNTDPQVLELTTTTWGKIMEIIQIYGEADEDICSPTAGVDLIIIKTGKGLSTNYDVQVAPGKSAPISADVVAKATDLSKFIADNYFRGEEQKALNAISEITGVALPRIGTTATRTPTAALTSASASVDDADVPFTPDTKTVTPDPVVETPVEDPLAAKRAEIARKRKEAEEAAAAELAALEASSDTGGASSSDADAILAELDGLVG